MPEHISKASLLYGLRPGQVRFFKMHPNNPSHRKGELSQCWVWPPGHRCGKRKLDLIFLPPPTFFSSLVNQQVLPQSTADSAAAPPWHATMLPDQSDCTQTMTQSHGHISMLLTFTACFEGLTPCDLIKVVRACTHTVCVGFVLLFCYAMQSSYFSVAFRGKKLISYFTHTNCVGSHITHHSITAAALSYLDKLDSTALDRLLVYINICWE